MIRPTNDYKGKTPQGTSLKPDQEARAKNNTDIAGLELQTSSIPAGKLKQEAGIQGWAK